MRWCVRVREGGCLLEGTAGNGTFGLLDCIGTAVETIDAEVDVAEFARAQQGLGVEFFVEPVHVALLQC